MVETTLQMLQRHILEGETRIIRQELLIARLEQHGSLAFLANAKCLREDMHEYQTKAERHLTDLADPRRDNSGRIPTKDRIVTR